MDVTYGAGEGIYGVTYDPVGLEKHVPSVSAGGVAAEAKCELRADEHL
jgi:hypothetical protein